MLPRHTPDRVHFDRQPGQMNRHDRACLLCDAGCDGFRIDIAVRPDIRQNRGRSRMQDYVDGGAEGQRRGDDLRSRADVESLEGQMQSGCAGIYGQRVRSADVFAELSFELLRYGVRWSASPTSGCW